MTETQARFLRDAATRLPLDRVVEVHLFPPIRQGGVETGIAVIAATRQPDGPAPVATEPEVEAPDVAQLELDDELEIAPGADWAEPEEVVVAASDAQPDDESPGDETMPDETAVVDDVPSTPPTAPARAVPERHTVFSARYRLWVKGPDRGRWEVNVIEEADAPIVTVDAVVRGILRRGGGDVDPDRIDADALRALAAEAPAAGSPPPVGGAGSARVAGARR